ncbi:MAG TPA: RNA polymerase sigma factor [Polyangia bacterium]|jgi:RNA polymerase sigma-70 factor (ECF subfamily)|nr:RNA polymerase sigma factor [Polyangia bacterium]
MAASGDGPTDAALVIEAQRGASQALEILFRRHTHRVRLLALVLMGMDSDLDDLVQDTFIQAQQSLSRLKAPESFGRWLSAIVVGTAHKVFRRRRMMARLGLLNQDPADLEGLVARTVSPEVAAQLKAACAAVDRLNDDLRSVFLLRRVDGLRLNDIAVHLKVSLSTVKRRLDAAENVMWTALGSAPIGA